MHGAGEIKISVIIPVYNMELYLTECIERVLEQSLTEIEIICVDDGSRDGSYTLLYKYATSDRRIRIIKQENQGVAYSRNVAIKEAKGKYIAFLDPDDYYPEKQTLEKLFMAAEENDVNIAGGGFSDFSVCGEVNTIYGDLLAGYTFQENRIIHYADYQFDYGYHRFIYNRQFIQDNNIYFPELVRFQDPPFMVQAMTKAKVFFAITDVTYCYRMDYKIIDWNEKRICDLLDGLNMNLSWSMENGLKQLNKLTVRRITEEYEQVILNQYKVSNMVREKLMDSLSLVDEESFEDMKEFVLQGIEMLEKTYRLEAEFVKNSWSYRIGLFMTYIPRKIAKIFCSS